MKQLKQFALTVLVALIGSLSASAHDFEAVNGGKTIYYKITSSEDLTCAVSYRGFEFNDYHDEYSGRIVIPSSVKYNGKTYSVTSIGDWAFCCCYSLTAITIPNSVTSIGEAAFDGCSGLTSINIPNSVTAIGDYAFRYCENLESFSGKFASSDNRCLIVDGTLNSFAPAGLTTYSIPNSVTSIGSDAFSYCSGLTSINIPNSVTEIGEAAFDGCSGLTSINIPNSVTSICSQAFYCCRGLTSINIPSSVTSIGSSAFSSCSGLTSINIPNSVTAIAEYTFSDCSGLTSVTIGSSVTSIGYGAFSGCSGLTSINIPDGVTEIGNFAFEYCRGLTSINIPNSVTSIGFSAFGFCENLESFSGKFASSDNRCLIVDGTLNSFAPAGLTTYSIPNSVTEIGNGAFDGCRGLTSITIPNSVTEIGDGAFYYCRGLTSITIPNSVTKIGDSAFSFCSGLTSVTIPNSITSIGKYAFSVCSGLTEITSMAVTPPSISYDTFKGVSKTEAVVKVPYESVDAYKAAEYWKEFSNFIGFDASEPVTKKCEAPTIELIDRMLVATSETEGAVCNTTITTEDVQSYVGNEPIKLSGVYKVTSFATAEGYEDSETVTMLLYWSKPSLDGETEMTLVGDLNGDGKVNIADLNLVIDIMSER